MRDEKPVNMKPTDGQNLLVRPDVVCAECGKPPKRATVVHFRDRLLCPKCYQKALLEEPTPLESEPTDVNDTNVAPALEPLDLLPPPKTREERLAEALGESLTRLDDSVAAWAKMAAGATDDQIRWRIAMEWQTIAGVAPGGKDYYCRPGTRGGKGAAFWFGYRSPAGKATLSGAALIARVREVLRIPTPKGNNVAFAGPRQDEAAKGKGKAKKS